MEFYDLIQAIKDEDFPVDVKMVLQVMHQEDPIKTFTLLTEVGLTDAIEQLRFLNHLLQLWA